MKTVLKSLVVGLMVFALSFSPALAGLAKAGGFNFEDISSIKTDDTQSYEKQPRGPMFNLSFGEPKDYKKTKSQVAMMDKDQVKTAVGVAFYIGIIALTIAYNDHDDADDDYIFVIIDQPPDELPPDDLPPEN